MPPFFYTPTPGGREGREALPHVATLGNVGGGCQDGDKGDGGDGEGGDREGGGGEGGGGEGGGEGGEGGEGGGTKRPMPDGRQTAPV